ncbi:AAA family ATPase [Proteiniclasticum ruminis]|uniref:ATPase/GTPase, AAA15 family n=1 Tax=Proteiniclasticum ruminis TaxID=398199 RepID=A0A1I5E0H1_9CLOT|nr:ATP-binding protein [Proteiniclasticum ruminis]SFO05024.1 ATPase/GTPase, AAA15 family [Proteiniclasticum ruminis]
MIIQFSIKNFTSFKDKVTLDLSAVHAYKEHESNLIDLGLKDKFLKVVSIYGANASGKSNLCLALDNFKKLVEESLNSAKEKEDLAVSKYYLPFEFTKERENTELELVWIHDHYEYKYGFEYNSEKIATEWFYKKNTKTNRNTTVFERNMDEIQFGASVRKYCEPYRHQIPKETLALTFLSKLKLPMNTFSDASDTITDIMVGDSRYFESKAYLTKFLPGVIDTDKENLLRFLDAIDSGIKDIYYEKSEDQTLVWTEYHDVEGNCYKLSLLRESHGTNKSIMLYILSKWAINNGYTMVIDELNTRLHPLLLKFIIDLFYEHNTQAQLIYTTHDTTLLDRQFFRRDQILFVNKDEFGRSELVALSDYKVRSDASFEKDYLAGVYGGIPSLSNYQL